MKRYYWIMMTYVTRPMMWLFALVVISAVGWVFVGESDTYSDFKLPIIIADQPILDSRSALLEFADKPDRVQIRLGRVMSNAREDLYKSKRRKSKRQANKGESIHVGDEELDLLVAGMDDAKFPENVEAISVRRGMDFLPRIAELESLKRLDFGFSTPFEKHDLTLLSKLKNLEILKLGTIHQLDSLSPLGELPKLHTLRLSRYGVATKEQMAEVANLPALKNLYLPRVSEKRLALAAIAELEQSTSLQSVFVDIPLSEPELLAKIQGRVPSIHVRSSQYRIYRLLLFAGAIWFAVILGFLGMHIAGQFSMPQAQLIPGYRMAHQRFTWALLSTLVLIASGIVSLAGEAKVLPVLAALGFIATFCIRSNADSKPLTKWSSISVSFRLACVALGICCIFWFMRHPIELEEYLMGRRQWIAIVFLMLAIVLAVTASRRMNDLARARYAAGLPLTLSMQDLQKVVADHAVAGEEGAKGKMNPHQATENFMPILGVAAIILVVARTWWGDQFFGSRGPGAMLQGIIAMFTAFLPVLIVFLIGVKWWQRMPYFATMITRPPSRISQVKDILDRVRKDFAFQLGPVFVALVILAVPAPFWQTEGLIVRAIASALFIVAITAVCYAAVLWGLVIRTHVGLIVLFIFLQFGVTVCAGLLTVVGLDLTSGVPAYRVVITAMVMFGLAAMGVSFAKRKYVALEWGKLL